MSADFQSANLQLFFCGLIMDFTDLPEIVFPGTLWNTLYPKNCFNRKR